MAHGGEPILEVSVGMASREARTSNGRETRYNLGSIMKHYTAVLVLQEVEAGAIGLDDRLETFELGFPPEASFSEALFALVVNQGVDVPISVDGEWVGPADRNTYVVGNRDTLLRGFWEIPEDWTGREITAVLELKYPDGAVETHKDTKTVDGPAFATCPCGRRGPGPRTCPSRAR